MATKATPLKNHQFDRRSETTIADMRRLKKKKLPCNLQIVCTDCKKHISVEQLDATCEGT